MRICIYILIFTIIFLVYYKNTNSYEGFFSPKKKIKKKLTKLRYNINKNNIHYVELFSNFLRKNVRKYKI